MRVFIRFLPALYLVIGVSTAGAGTIHVPADSSTIQAGIDGAADGDTVLVADGIYSGEGNRNIDFLGKRIVVVSRNGPVNCIVDCQQQGRGFFFHNGEMEESVLEGFTVRDGYTTEGGAILCVASSPTIAGNRIIDNMAIYGGGIYCKGLSSPNITGNVITDNYGGDVDGGSGGGIYGEYVSQPTIVGNTIAGNGATEKGGGIYCTGSSTVIDGNTIRGNRVYYFSGGGIYCGGSAIVTGNTISGNVTFTQISGFNSGGGGIFCMDSVTIEDNRIVGNDGGDDGSGGGIHCFRNSKPLIRDNEIEGNEAGNSGGGIYLRRKARSMIEDNRLIGNRAAAGGGIYCSSESVPHIERNVIAGNQCSWGGGGIHFYESSPLLDGNTVVGNTAGHGGGIYCKHNASPVITNSIFWSDSPDEMNVESGNPAITYSDVQGGWPGTGNIQTYPLFVVPMRKDFRLLWNSPCIDAGDPDSLDGDSTRRDIGAFFFDQDDYLTLYITPDTTEGDQGGQVGVTYTVINRWERTEQLQFLSRVKIPGGRIFPVLGPVEHTMPPESTFQIHLIHDIPSAAPTGTHEYRSFIGIWPDTLYDYDSFTLYVTPSISE